MEVADEDVASSSAGPSNDSDSLPLAPQLDRTAIVKTTVLTVIAVVSVVGNVATLINIRLQKHQTRSTIYVFIFQLALADVLVSVLCAAGEAAWTFTVQWLADDFTCKLTKYLQMFSLYLSTYVLVLIGVDRYIAIRYPIKAKEAHHRCNAQIVLVWTLSAIFSLPQIFIFRVQQGPFAEEFYQCVTYGSYTAAWQEQLYTLLTLLLMFIIPLAIILSTYIAMFRAIANSVSSFQSKEESSGVMNRVKRLETAKNKSLKLTVVIVCTFLVCWTPYYVMMIAFIFLEPTPDVSDQMQSGVFFFGMSNSMLNPLIYGAFHLRRGGRGGQDKSSLRSSRHIKSINHTMVTSASLGYNSSRKERMENINQTIV